MNVFQSIKKKIAKQIKNSWASFPWVFIMLFIKPT
jgi:hypothetical protein